MDDMENTEKFIGAKAIKTNTVITENWVRFKCEHRCGYYNTNLNCPPYTPTVEKMRNILEDYEDGDNDSMKK